MELYIEDYIIINIISNFPIIYISMILLRERISMPRIIVLTFICVVCSIIYLFIIEYLLLFKLSVAIVLAGFIRHNNTIKQLLMSLTAILISTNAIAIISIGIMMLLDDLSINFNSDYSYAIAAIVALFSALVIKNIINKLIKKRARVKYTLRAELVNGNIIVNDYAFMDTGNLLLDDNLRPVVILDKCIINKLALTSTHISIYVNTLNGEKSYKKYIIPLMYIYENGISTIHYNVSAICSDKVLKNTKIIIGSEMI